jgi:hypothetical protein
MLDRLPNELLCNIVLLLPQNDQAKLTCINKHIHELAESVRYQDVDLEGGQEQLFSLVNRILLDIKILSQVRRLTIARKNDSRDTVAPKVLSDPSLNHMWSYFESQIPFNTEARWEVGSYWRLCMFSGDHASVLLAYIIRAAGLQNLISLRCSLSPGWYVQKAFMLLHHLLAAGEAAWANLKDVNINHGGILHDFLCGARPTTLGPSAH